VISGIERVAKPDQRIFKVLVERYDLNPAATIFVDDMQQNVDAACALGFQALRFTSAERLRDTLSKRGIAVTRNGM
jgi:2-haloacid dehalogenase